MRCPKLLLLALLAAPVSAETVVTCGTAEPVVATRVTQYLLSAHGPAYPGSLIDPDLSAVLAFPVSEWKCNGATVERMTAQERADVLSAELAARQALALTLYGQTGCDLTSGDQFIGLCEAGEVLTSQLFEDALDDWFKRRLQVADGRYLRREGALIVGWPALPSGRRIEVAGPVAVGTVETVLASLPSMVMNVSASKVLLWAKADFTKDTGTTARVVTLRIRRVSDNALIGQPCVARSQPLASTEFGPCSIVAVDVNPTAPGTVSYDVTGIVGAGATNALRVVLVTEEVQAQ